MPQGVVKPSRDEDFYVVWSDVVEAPVAFGDREAVIEYLREHDRPQSDSRLTPEGRVNRAAQTGTSYLWPSPDDPAYGWSDDAFIYMQRGILRRANLKALCERLGADESDRCTDLLEPFEDCGEVRP